MEEGPNQDEAFDFVARSFGFNSSEEYFNWLAEQRGLTRADMQGLTDEEKSEYDKMMRMDMANQERMAQTQMEAVFADTGSAIQYMAAADEANQRITNTRMQYQFEQMNQNTMLQSQALEQKLNQYSQMVTQGQMSALQYMDMRQRGYESLLSGYMGQAQLALQEFNVVQQGAISALTGAAGTEESRLALEQGAMTSALAGYGDIADLKLRESAQDLEVLNAQFNSVYNSMMIQTGINKSILETVNQAYQTSMVPIMDAVNAYISRLTMQYQATGLSNDQLAIQVEQQTGLFGMITNIAGSFLALLGK